MKALQLSVHFKPNIGGVETHLDDLLNALVKRGWQVDVLAYQPLTTVARWKLYEKTAKTSIFRIPWLPNFFYRLLNFPVLEFFYLVPGLFLVTPFILLAKNPDVIHAHGLVAGFTAIVWGRIFRKRIVISSHSIYSFPKKGLYRDFASWIFKNADCSLGLSKKATDEILSLGANRIKKFTYWVDLDKFKNNKKIAKKNKLVVLFVGRLVAEKGLIELLDSAKTWDKKISLLIIGSGPLEATIKEKVFENVDFIGAVKQENLSTYYNKADFLIVPSTSEEGFGRVIIEALACGTPVIGSNRGAISETITNEVGELIEITPKNIKRKVEYYYHHQDKLRKMANKCRDFAERRYSEKNVEEIIATYRR